jgi:RNA polymerase sigma factor (sigma-70 family)
MDDSARQNRSPELVTSTQARVSSPRWTLTQEAFDKLLRQLDPDLTSAAEKYEQLRRKLIKFFKWRGCLEFEEYADKTIDRVARKITEGAELQATSPSALFYGVAVLMLKEHWRKTAIRQEIPANDIEISSEDPEEIRAQAETFQEREKRLACLRSCLGELPAESVDLIKQYYSEGDVMDKEQRKQIAERLNLSATALRSRAFRVRGQLERCVNKCLEES